MKEYTAQAIRNIALLGHGSEGKSTLAEAMLFTSGAIDRMGRIEDGQATMDSDAEETKRGISISLAMAPVEWKNVKCNLVDVPGYFDLVGEAAGAMRVVESALILVSAVGGLSVGAEKAWSMTAKAKAARVFVVNQMDRENANFMKTFEQIKEKYGAGVVAVQLPIMQGATFAGVVDVIRQTAYKFGAKGACTPCEIPADMADAVAAMRETVTEAAAAGNDALMEKYFETMELSTEEIIEGGRACILDGSMIPVLCCAAAPNLGMAPLMDFCVDMLPSPQGREFACTAGGKDTVRKGEDGQPLSLLVFKTVADPFVGKLSFFRVMSGVVTPDSMAVNTVVGDKPSKLSALYVMRGKKQIPAEKLHAGDLGAVAKLQSTLTGHTLCDAASPVVYPAIEFPAPQITLAVHSSNQGDEEKVFAGLNKLLEEDPSFTLAKSADTTDMLMSGQGELHLEIVCAKLKNKYSVAAVLGTPQIPYRETIRKSVSAQGRYKKQSGGSGQFGDVHIRFSPITDEAEGDFVFVDEVVGGSVPRNFIPAVEKGLRECIKKGVLAGYPMVGLKCALYDGSSHPVDSSEIAFRLAARVAYKKACGEANPTLMEPIYRIEVQVPDEYMGDVIGDLNRRRGHIMGMNQVDEGQEVIGEVPLAEVFRYATDLRSMTQARGSYRIIFERYEDVPGNIAAKVVEIAKKQMEEEGDE